MKDGGLAHIIRSLLDCKTLTQAQGVIDQTGNDYLALAKELLDRLKFKRTPNQNALYYMRLAEISKQTGDTEIELRRFCKYTFGCPILFEKDDRFERFCRDNLGHLTHEEKLGAMDFIAISSLMTTKEMKRYMDQIATHYRAQGYHVTEPEGEN